MTDMLRAFIERRIQDIRFALRQLRKNPAFAATAVATLAVGLSANVAIFGFVDAALLRPLPYQESPRLVTAFGTRPDLAQSQRRGFVSYLNFLDWRARTRAFRSIAAYDVRAGFTLTTAAGPERVSGLRVTSGFFRTLGVTPVLGREFNRDEEGPHATPTVMLAYNAWQTRFGTTPDVLGQIVILQGEPHLVIGVLPRDFHFSLAEHADFWATIRGPQPCWDVRSCRSLETVARLADRVSREEATTELDAIVQDLRRQYPDPNPETAKVMPLREVMLGDIRPIMLMLTSGAGLLLLIACINLVSLLLVRSDSRTREIAVRNALGASSAQLLLQFATEALILVAAGSVAGLALGSWAMGSLRNLLSAGMVSRMPYLQQIGLTGRVIGFACAVSSIAAVVFALTPVVRVSVSERFSGLKEVSRGSAGTTWRRFGSYLVVAELAIALILLASAGLLGKSLYLLLHVDTGFNMQQLVTVSVSPVVVPPSIRSEKDNDAQREQPGALARQVAERVAALPGVEAVGYADLLPLGPGLAPSSGFRVVGRPAQGVIDDHPVRRVSAGYFAALQARLLRGRYFTDEEVASTRPVMIINETARRRYFPDADAIGESIAFGVPSDSSPARKIVGVIADITDGPPETPAHPAAYIPFDQIGFVLAVRTSQAERSLLPLLSVAIRQVQPGLLVQGQTTMTQRMNGLPSASMHRASAWVVGGFAGVALLLSVVGLYGVVAYSVGQRRREIGVRMALGAERRSVYQLVLGQAALLVSVGTALGIVCAVAVATAMRRLFFGVQSWDTLTLATTAAVLIVSALLASYIPARRAASVNPIEVLRAE